MKTIHTTYVAGWIVKKLVDEGSTVQVWGALYPLHGIDTGGADSIHRTGRKMLG